MTTLSPTDFKFYQDFLLAKSGLSLSQEKSYLLSTRLGPVASSLGYADIAALTEDLRKTAPPDLTRAVIEAMTTNETSFFRDTKPFESLKKILPALMEARAHKKTLRIWSAACSSGQECYSLAMVLREFFADKPGWKCQIIGTDISYDILDAARKGEYSQFEVQRGLTIQMMVQNFEQVGNVWRINNDLKEMCTFQYANLLDDFSHLGTFDIIFCRNVLIYFNSETKARVLNGMAHRLTPDGYLFLGACETTINLPVLFQNMPGQHGILTPDLGKAVTPQPQSLWG